MAVATDTATTTAGGGGDTTTAAAEGSLPLYGPGLYPKYRVKFECKK
jgi:hypothetical protein